MSDPDDMPDPIDQAYVRAETVLSDDEARTARRARVLAAMAREPMATPAVSPRSPWRPARRPGGWLVAAGVAGLSVVLATQLYQPAPRPRQAAPALAAAPVLARPSPSAVTVTAPVPVPGSMAKPPPLQAFPASPPIAPVAPPAAALSVPMDMAPPPPAPAAPAAMIDPSTRGFTLFSKGGNLAAVVTSERRAPVAATFDEAARLRAAAAAGRTEEIEALLARGVAVDAPDADGDTALMKSIQADRPAVAALLRSHGASLDRANHAGDSARDMATAKGDAALNQALGLEP